MDKPDRRTRQDIERLGHQATHRCKTRNVESGKAASEFRFALGHRIVNFCDATLRQLKRLDKRMNVIKNLATASQDPSSGMSRQKRGIISFEGTALKWLFGVATTSDINKIADAVQREKGRSTEIY